MNSKWKKGKNKQNNKGGKSTHTGHQHDLKIISQIKRFPPVFESAK